MLAFGTWAQDGLGLRTLAEAEDSVLEVVVRINEPKMDFAMRVGEEVFADIQDIHGCDFLHQFSVTPRPRWDHALVVVRARGREEASLGIPLLVRA